MVRAMKRKLHGKKGRDWAKSTLKERLEAVE
jgi:hypothetical protein